MCMCAECFLKKYWNFAKKSGFFENKEVVSYGNYDTYVIFSTSLCPYTLNYLFAKLYCCITSNNDSVSILKFQNCHFEIIAFKVNIIMLIA